MVSLFALAAEGGLSRLKHESRRADELRMEGFLGSVTFSRDNLCAAPTPSLELANLSLS